MNEVVIKVSVNNSRQLFNDRDPSPFKDHDLDENFVRYLLNSVQAYPFKTNIRLKIEIEKEPGSSSDQAKIQEAIHSYFQYEAALVHSRKKKSVREGRLFLLIGLISLFGCLSLSQVLESAFAQSKFMLIMQEGLVIIGWVTMWRPLEMFLYDWRPLHEQEIYMNKLAEMKKDILFVTNLK